LVVVVLDLQYPTELLEFREVLLYLDLDQYLQLVVGMVAQQVHQVDPEDLVEEEVKQAPVVLQQTILDQPSKDILVE
jgi:hypothetical protein